MESRILVTGATGKVGREIVRILLTRKAIVRAATRDPATARRLFGESVEIVELDYDATETWDNAVTWVDSMFLMPPPFDPHASETLGSFLDWAVSSEVGRVVLLSAMGAATNPDLALRKVEQHLQELGIAFTILRPNLYMQNFSSGFLRDAIRDRDRFELNAGDGRVSFVDVRDVAAVAAAALGGGPHDGREYTLTGTESFGFVDVARLLTEAAGRTITYAPVEAARMRALMREHGWPEAQADVAARLYESVRSGVREPVHDDLEQILGRAPRRFADYAQGAADAWRKRATDRVGG